VIGIIVLVYILNLASLAKMELKTGYKLLIAFAEVLMMLIIAASFLTLMYIFHSESRSLSVVVGQSFALILSFIVNGIIMITYNMIFLSPRRKSKEVVFMSVLAVTILIHLIFSFSFGWKTDHNDEKYISSYKNMIGSTINVL